MLSNNNPVIPVDNQAEQAVLAGMMHCPQLHADILSIVEEKDFAMFRNEAIFSALKEMSAKGVPFDLITVDDFVKRSKKYEDAANIQDLAYGSEPLFAYIADVYIKKVLAQSAVWYAKRVKDLSVKRELMEVCKKGYESASNLGTSSDTTRTEIETALGNLSYAEMDEEIDDITANESLVNLVFNPAQEVILHTGLYELDYLLEGLRPKQVVVIGARPGMGKSMLGLTIADNLARRGKFVYFSTIEMTANEMAERRMAFTARVALSAIRGDKTKISSEGRERIVNAQAKIASYPGRIIFNEGKMSPSKLLLRGKVMKARGQLDAIVIDYLQIMTPDVMTDSTVTNVSSIAQSLKNIAKELDVPIIELAQLNRDVGKRGGKPVVTDLRESGAIEQAADIIIMIHREFMDEEAPKRFEPVELLVLKNRSGKRGIAHVMCETGITHFANMERKIEG